MLFKMIRLVLWYFLPKIVATAVRIAHNMQKLVIFLQYFHQIGISEKKNSRNLNKKLKQILEKLNRVYKNSSKMSTRCSPVLRKSVK